MRKVCLPSSPRPPPCANSPPRSHAARIAGAHNAASPDHGHPAAEQPPRAVVSPQLPLSGALPEQVSALRTPLSFPFSLPARRNGAARGRAMPRRMGMVVVLEDRAEAVAHVFSRLGSHARPQAGESSERGRSGNWASQPENKPRKTGEGKGSPVTGKWDGTRVDAQTPQRLGRPSVFHAHRSSCACLPATTATCSIRDSARRPSGPHRPLRRQRPPPRPHPHRFRARPWTSTSSARRTVGTADSPRALSSRCSPTHPLLCACVRVLLQTRRLPSCFTIPWTPMVCQRAPNSELRESPCLGIEPLHMPPPAA